MNQMSPLSCFVACALGVGLWASPLRAQQARDQQETVAASDPLKDLRIDQREHPNAPRAVPTRSPLDVENENPATAPKDDPVFLEFAAWIQKYRLSTADKKPGLVEEGLNLAKTRRAALAALIASNPKRALDWAVSHENRAILPLEIIAQLETRIVGCGEYSVLMISAPAPANGLPNNPSNIPNTAIPPRNNAGTRPVSTITRYVVIEGKIFKAYVYGWRTKLTTKYNIPLHGVAVDNLLAVSINPIRILEPDEAVPAKAKIGNPDKKCPLCGADFHHAGGVVAQIGGTYYFFDSAAHAKRLAEAFIEIEQSVAGPKVGSLCDEPLNELLEQIKQSDFLKAGLGAGNNGAPTGTF